MARQGPAAQRKIIMGIVHPPPQRINRRLRHCARCGHGFTGERCSGCRARRRELIRRLAELIDAKPDEVVELLKIGGAS